VLPNYWSIVVDRIEVSQEFSKIPNPSCHFFAFDVSQSESCPSDEGLIVGDHPVHLKIQIQFIKKIICQGSFSMEDARGRSNWSNVLVCCCGVVLVPVVLPPLLGILLLLLQRVLLLQGVLLLSEGKGTSSLLCRVLWQFVLLLPMQLW